MSSETTTPFRPKISPRAEALLNRIEWGEDLEPHLERDYLVKGWIDRGTLSVVYGDANAGKTFWAIDVAHHVQSGLSWGGQRVRQAEVLYIAAEGGALFDNRVAARRAKFKVLRGGIALAGRNSDAPALAEAAWSLACEHGPFGLIIVDTMARVMAGADENSAADIAGFVKSLDHLRERTGAHVMVIHHTGKDGGRGARGHSSLRAAVDTEIELSKGDNGTRLAKTTKQRDMQGGLEKEFLLRVEQLGVDSDGDPVTSCIVEQLKGG
ncbi:AAA family ATPase [Pararhodobacter aggregans]|uniref:AAA+ ATPase domain-containing protein n=1 Tax=Pararhodobacter aggregans TaxID=404875 RepID=A0A2T7UQT0_9RHOB|nr:AAA family ATPase [Pararhodobacter aggregans]PTX01823.1 AAA domain-containing protein [Pararhodobacter aggregans]PVE47022.1 hypothetical protein DDE23_12230 [Pararhodobacter aggregans]